MATLPAWSNAWIEFELDPATGSWEVRRTTKAGQEDLQPIGFASLEPFWGFWPRFYAFYAHDDHLYFQAGRRRWDITNGVPRCKFWMAGFGFMSGLLLRFENGQSHRPVLIHPLRWFSANLDPTYDGIDFDADHFFYYLREHMPREEWRRGFIERARGPRDAAV